MNNKELLLKKRKELLLKINDLSIQLKNINELISEKSKKTVFQK